MDTNPRTNPGPKDHETFGVIRTGDRVYYAVGHESRALFGPCRTRKAATENAHERNRFRGHVLETLTYEDVR